MYEYTPEKTLYKKVKRFINRGNATDYLDSLVRDVERYRRIFEPDNYLWTREEQPVKASLAALSMFKVRQPTPAILSLLRAYRSGRLSIRQLKSTLSAIERFHFLYTAVSGLSSSGGLSMMYASLARDISSEERAPARAARLQDFRQRLNQRLPDEEVFAAGFSALKYSQLDSRGRPLVAYILRKVDRLLRDNDAPVDYDRMTIEHIAPQNPPAGQDRLLEYASIGNLILVSEDLNNRLRNRPFSDKKRSLRRGGVPMDEALSESAEWGDEQIQARAQALSALVYNAEI
jgi:hypothetical protein